jgi:two-component system, chemotaxis family, sensor kinase Cph1
MLKPQAAFFLALVIHELAANAGKYGSLSITGGRVDVAWTIPDNRPLRLELRWTEHGGPKIEALPKRGCGTELIERGIRFEWGRSKAQGCGWRPAVQDNYPGEPPESSFGVDIGQTRHRGCCFMTAPLQGRRVLVVEDEFLVAMLIQEMLETAGCLVSSPISRLAEALDAAGREDCDAAVLDVNLAGDRIYPVAEILSRRNVPLSLSQVMVKVRCRWSTPRDHASASRSRWQTCSARHRASCKAVRSQPELQRMENCPGCRYNRGL